MTPLDLARAFLAKAREDEVLLAKLVTEPEVSDDIFGFHVQQAAEKCLKAVLAVGEARPGRTHDLGSLLDEIESHGGSVPAEVRAVEEWSPYAVRNRYPFFGDAPPVNRPAALALVRAMRAWVEHLLPAGEAGET